MSGLRSAKPMKQPRSTPGGIAHGPPGELLLWELWSERGIIEAALDPASNEFGRAFLPAASKHNGGGYRLRLAMIDALAAFVRRRRRAGDDEAIAALEFLPRILLKGGAQARRWAPIIERKAVIDAKRREAAKRGGKQRAGSGLRDSILAVAQSFKGQPRARVAFVSRRVGCSQAHVRRVLSTSARAGGSRKRADSTGKGAFAAR